MLYTYVFVFLYITDYICILIIILFICTLLPSHQLKCYQNDRCKLCFNLINVFFSLSKALKFNDQ